MHDRMTLTMVLAFGLAGPAMADSATLEASKDNTLYEDRLGLTSNGSGEHFFAGTTAFGPLKRRGLVAFDVAGSIPAGSTITAASLTLYMSRTNAGAVDVSLHRVMSDWGEGDSDAPGEEGAGAPSTPGDATWIHTFFDTELWASPGGDFVGDASATLSVGGVGFYTWEMSDGLVQDVQGWLDDPKTNFGWLVLGGEASAALSKRFDSRENAVEAFRPALIVEFDPPGSRCPQDLDMSDDVGFSDLLSVLAAWGPCNACPADFDMSGDVGFSDLLSVLAAWGPCP